jgi:hypothetical protein
LHQKERLLSPEDESSDHASSARVSRVLACHIGDATNLALAPTQCVVFKGRHVVEMACVIRYHATFTQTSERTDYHRPTGSKGVRIVKLYRRSFIFVATHVAPSVAARLLWEAPLLATYASPRACSMTLPISSLTGRANSSSRSRRMVTACDDGHAFLERGEPPRVKFRRVTDRRF